jgi:glutamate---cysteine ligase / carboxylate-amine ligase
MPSRTDAGRPPDWSAWHAAGPPWTVGVEEEFVLLDGATWAAANRVDDVLAAAPPAMRAHLSAETHACVVELKTGPARTVAGAMAELVARRRGVDALLRRLGLRAAVAGTHPLLDRADIRLAPFARYREIGDTMRVLARREPTMALHVHVAVPDAEAAVRASNGLRADLPALLALAANSPFWRGEDSGFDAIRVPIFGMFPRIGAPRAFRDYDDWIATIDTLVGTGAIPDPGFIWWDVRLRPHQGTVEVRVMDAQSRTGDTAALVAAVQCLVRTHAEAAGPPGPSPEVLAENRFLAARDGLRAELVDVALRTRRPATDVVEELLETCTPRAAELRCVTELAAVRALAADPGAARQRAIARREGLAALPRRLAEQFAPLAAAALATV